MSDRLRQVWGQVTTVQESLPTWAVLATAAVAAALVFTPRLWPVTRHGITIAHEGAHALVAVATGRRLQGIRLHSDTSGVTTSVGQPHGLGMVLTAAAGYPGPALLAYAGGLALGAGRSAALLWGTLLALAAILVWIRNVFGLATIAVTGAIVGSAAWWGSDLAQGLVGSLLVWLLALGSLRPVIELQLKRRAGQAPESDADQLAALTGIPGTLWVGVFGLLAVGALVVTGKGLLF